MYGLDIEDILTALQGDLYGQIKSLPRGASIDTRTLLSGDLFFAIKGENTDGHNFLKQAYAKGASGGVVERIPEGFNWDNLPLILVQDVSRALQNMAQRQRSLFQGPVIAVTGSTGKTTTKDMLSSILGVRGPVLTSCANYNNELGLPLTILAVKQEHQGMVLEMGMRGLGEIDCLAAISNPVYAIITNIGYTHLELLGTRANIAQAKAEVIPYLPREGGLVLPAADRAFLEPWLEKARCPVSWVGLNEPADIWAEDVQVQTHGLKFQMVSSKGSSNEIRLPVPGRHNIENALCAAALGHLVGISWQEIKEGLERVALSPMRLQIKRNKRLDITVINDAYNANPASMVAALEVLADRRDGGRKIAVLGDMYELGDYSPAGHKIVGSRAARSGLAYLITVGNLAAVIAQEAMKKGYQGDRVRICANKGEAMASLKEILQPQDIILVKGSRGVKMEEIAEGLLGL